MTGATRGRDREYDRFGPWVLEITGEDPPPRLFEPYLRGMDEPLLRIKVPRRIARREARPGMDLYDFVVVLGEQRLWILERRETGVREQALAYRDIRHLSVHEELLRGTLTLATKSGTYELPYNTVSAELMGRVSGLIRARLAGSDAAQVVPMPAAADTGQLSFYFERLWRERSAADPSLRALASQASVSLEAIEPGRLRRRMFGLVEKRLLESLHLCDGRELHVLDRGRPFAYRWQSVYGRRETTIPLGNVTGVSWQGAAAGQPFATLTVSTAGGESSWAFTTGAAAAAAPYRAWLEANLATRR